tara:strand:- start:295 stop:558 length:264 start_codon:yes stop_codon:yes gene_type:complete
MDIATIEMSMYDSEAKVQLIDSETPFVLKNSDSLTIEGVYDSSFKLTPWGADMVICATDPSVTLDNGEKLVAVELYAKHRDFKLILS